MTSSWGSRRRRPSGSEVTTGWAARFAQTTTWASAMSAVPLWAGAPPLRGGPARTQAAQSEGGFGLVPAPAPGRLVLVQGRCHRPRRHPNPHTRRVGRRGSSQPRLPARRAVLRCGVSFLTKPTLTSAFHYATLYTVVVQRTSFEDMT